MNVRKIIEKRLRARLGGVRIDGDADAAVAANVGERNAFTTASTGVGDHGEKPGEQDGERPA